MSTTQEAIVSEQPVRASGGAPERWGRGAVLGLGAALCWFAWLAWDDTYQIDPATGVASGPYEVWQVLGAVLSLAVLATLGAVWAGARPTVVSLTIGFTVAWSSTAAPSDDTGLWGVGALLVLVGVALGSGLVTLVVTRLRRGGPSPV